MSEQIRQYFERYAENGIAQVKRSLVAISFYDDVRKRQVRGEDLSQELEGIKLAGPDKTLQVVLESIEEYKEQMKGAWKLHDNLLRKGKFSYKQVKLERELMPRFEIEYVFENTIRSVKVEIRTAGETFKIYIDAGKDSMRSQMALHELERELTFIALISY
jgi:hypothetical protein